MEKVIHRQVWEDDRAACDGCKRLFYRHVVTKYDAADMEKFRKVNHPALRWMFEVAQVHEKVATVEYTRRACRAKGLEPMPEGLLHRCPAFRPKIDESIKEDGWWQDEGSGSSTTSSPSWWQG